MGHKLLQIGICLFSSLLLYTQQHTSNRMIYIKKVCFTTWELCLTMFASSRRGKACVSLNP